MANAADAIWLPVLPSMKDFGPALIKGTAEAADKAGDSAGKRMGKGLALGLVGAAGAATAAGKALYEIGSTFDDVTDTIRVGTGAQGKALDGLVATAKNVGKQVPSEFEDIGSTVADVNTRMGLSGETLEKVSSQYLQAGNILGETVDINKTSAAFEAFGIKGDDVSGAMDHLFQVSQATGVGMNELASSALRSAPALKTLGFSFEETTALAGTLDKAGLNTGAMMAAMSKGLVTLAKDGEKPQEAFKRTVTEIDGFIKKGDQAGALALASKVFGTKGATQFVDAVGKGAVSLDSMAKAAGQTGDTILGLGDETADFAESWQLFKNNGLVLLEPIASRVFGVIGSAMGAMTEGVQAFGSAWEANDGKITASGFPGFMQGIAVGARGLFGFFSGTLLPVFKQLWSGLQTSLMPVLASVWQAFETNLLPVLKQLVPTFLQLWQQASPFSIILHAVQPLLPQLSAAFGQVAGAVGQFLGQLIPVAREIAGAIIPAVTSLVSSVLPPLIDIFSTVIVPLFRTVASVVTWALTHVVVPAIRAVTSVVQQVLVPVLTWLLRSVVTPIFQGIAKTVTWAWENVLRPVFRAVTSVLKDGLGPAFRWLKDSVIDPVWNGIKSIISTVWERGIKPVFDTISKVVTKTLPEAFGKAKEAIESVFRGIANIAREPINFVVNTVYNNGLKALFNGVAETLKLPWRLPNVAEIPAFAKGGRHKGGWALVGEEGPELVDFDRPGRVYTAAQTRDMLDAKTQAPAEALPALSGDDPERSRLPIGGFWGDVWKHIEGGAKAALGWVRGRIGDGLRALVAPLKSTIEAMLPGSGFNELIRGAGTSLIDSMVRVVAGEDDRQEKAAEASGEGSGAVYDGPLGAFHRPSAGPFTSMFGPRNTRFGSFHAGVDIAGGGNTYAALDGIAQRVGWNIVAGRTGIGILLNHAKDLWTYYGHNPSMAAVKVRPGDKVKAGQHIGQQGATGNVTGVHLHFEVHKGGVGSAVNPLPYLHDNGGKLQPGISTIANLTRKPEYILNDQQWTAMYKLAEIGGGDGGGDTYQVFANEAISGQEVADALAFAGRSAKRKG